MDKWIENGGQSAVLTYKQRRQSMEREKLEEREEEILVLDEGIDVEAMADPRGFCCRGPLTPLR